MYWPINVTSSGVPIDAQKPRLGVIFFSVVLTSLVVIVFNTNFFVSDSQYKTLTWKFLITLNIKNNGFVIHVNSLYISIN